MAVWVGWPCISWDVPAAQGCCQVPGPACRVPGRVGTSRGTNTGTSGWPLTLGVQGGQQGQVRGAAGRAGRASPQFPFPLGCWAAAGGEGRCGASCAQLWSLCLSHRAALFGLLCKQGFFRSPGKKESAGAWSGASKPTAPAAAILY